MVRIVRTIILIVTQRGLGVHSLKHHILNNVVSTVISNNVRWGNKLDLVD